ncbi:MAG: twin-arginine translocase TatA/TatE family subunit [Bacteroidia bacterium]|nr:twin-arginine translocase TatA/TatE family subunit [Bacteroidia bacterium]
MLLFISTSEVLFVIFIAFLLFGAKRIPEIARGLGKSVGELKKVTDDIKKK